MRHGPHNLLFLSCPLHPNTKSGSDHLSSWHSCRAQEKPTAKNIALLTHSHAKRHAEFCAAAPFDTTDKDAKLNLGVVSRKPELGQHGENYSYLSKSKKYCKHYKVDPCLAAL